MKNAILLLLVTSCFFISCGHHYKEGDGYITVYNNADVSLTIQAISDARFDISRETSFDYSATNLPLTIEKGAHQKITFSYRIDTSQGYSPTAKLSVAIDCLYETTSGIQRPQFGTKEGDSVKIDTYNGNWITDGEVLDFVKTTDGKYVLARVSQ